MTKGTLMWESKDGKNPLTYATQESAFSNKSTEELNLIFKSDVHGSSEANPDASTDTAPVHRYGRSYK